MQEVGVGPYRAYSLAIRAIVESALTTWAGLVLYECASYSEYVSFFPQSVRKLAR
jgi:hypothetical protein